jgi:PTH1 family peptidyl-tRNA hydrolase
MKAVVGLGNPGPKYARSRHNVGFEVLAELARRQGTSPPKAKFEADIVDLIIGTEKVLLVAPQTFMNNSGRSVRKLADFYELPLDNLLVVCDDLNLPTGRLRFRPSGTAGGQKGLGDIIQRMGTQDIGRLRIGIGRPPGRIDATDYVLGRFSSLERELIAPAVCLAADGVETWCTAGMETAMNQFNAPPATGN